MTGATTPGGRSPGAHGGAGRGRGQPHPQEPAQDRGHPPGSDHRELWPRDLGRDGVSGLLTLDRAMRARDVSRPDPDADAVAQEVLGSLLARVDGRRG